MPVRMKGAQVTMHNNKLYIGGGYTGHKRSEMTVYEYDPNFDLWAELPISPMRWFGMTEYKGQLVLVGGKDTIVIILTVFASGNRCPLLFPMGTISAGCVPNICITPT